MNHSTEEPLFVSPATRLEGDEIAELGAVSKSTRGSTPGGFEGPDCLPRRFAPNCP